MNMDIDADGRQVEAYGHRQVGGFASDAGKFAQFLNRPWQYAAEFFAEYRRQRGSFCGIPVIVTHHPSYLLRTNDLAERRAIWEEILAAMELAGLPISDKQRAFFTKRSV